MGSLTSPRERCYKSQRGVSGLQLKHVVLQQLAVSTLEGSQALQTKKKKKKKAVPKRDGDEGLVRRDTYEGPCGHTEGILC